jgi:ATP-dependent RNA helicase CshB
MSLYDNIGYKKLTPIQEKVYSAFKRGKNIVGIAPTGTGKTHAYLVPILEQIETSSNYVHSIIIVPTTELVIQTFDWAKVLRKDLKIKAFHGKTNMDEEIEKFSKEIPDVIIGTPAKILKLSKSLNFKNTRNLVLDESDMLFQEDFMKDIDNFLTPMKMVRFLLFSATFNKGMEPFIKKYFGKYEHIDTYLEHSLKIDNRLIKVSGTERLLFLKEVLKCINPYSALIFVTNNKDIDLVFQMVREVEKKTCIISSNLSLTERKNIMRRIKDNEFIYIVGSDLSSRGIDLKISHVINYDLPMDLSYFIHRMGRTGRMGDSGQVITIYQDYDTPKLTKLSETIKFKEYIIKDNEMVFKSKKSSFLA